MLSIPPALQARLDAGVTMLCRCWRLDRGDGVALGFTDHDRTIRFDGVSFLPETAVSASALDRAEGLARDTIEIAGALRADALRARDVERGLYDGAEIRLWRVDWSDPSLRVLQFRGRLGEIRRLSGPIASDALETEAGAFSAEIHGLADNLHRPMGRQILGACDARLGDARCGVDLDALAAPGSVVAVEPGRTFLVSGLETAASGWFSRGALSWTVGANAPLAAEVKTHARLNDAVRLTLWAEPPEPVSIGDAFTITPGCDKRWKTCRDRFANHLNFRGFPHTPGDDWVASYPAKGGRHDGRSMNR